MSSALRVLLIERDGHPAQPLPAPLSAHGHRLARCRMDPRALAANNDADLVLLRLDRTDATGLEVLRQLRQMIDVPVLLVGGGRNQQRQLRTSAGLDGLLSAAKALGSTAGAGARPPEYVVRVGDLAIDLLARRVHVDRRVVALTAKEFDILAVLARRLGVAVTRRQIMVEVWGVSNRRNSHSLDVHLAALRAKLGSPAALQTIRGFGYRLGEPA